MFTHALFPQFFFLVTSFYFYLSEKELSLFCSPTCFVNILIFFLHFRSLQFFYFICDLHFYFKIFFLTISRMSFLLSDVVLKTKLDRSLNINKKTMIYVCFPIVDFHRCFQWGVFLFFELRSHIFYFFHFACKKILFDQILLILKHDNFFFKKKKCRFSLSFQSINNIDMKVVIPSFLL